MHLSPVRGANGVPGGGQGHAAGNSGWRSMAIPWMASNGAPDTVVSAWAGHSDLGFTKRTYVHPDPSR